MEKDRADELLGMLVDVRGASRGNRELLRRLADGELRALTDVKAMVNSNYRALRFHEKRWIHAVAVGKSRPRAILSGRSAARVLGMWVVSTSAESVELVLPSGGVPKKAKWAEGTSFYKGAPAPSEVVTGYAGIAVTDYVKTAFDIATRHGFAEGLVAFDWLLKHGKTTKKQLAARIQALRGSKGVKVLREVLTYAVDNSESPYESYARALLILGGVTGIRTQIRIGPFRVDMLIGKLAVEVDGEEKFDGVTYKPLDQTLREERERTVYIQNNGFVVRRTQPNELLRDPDGFVRMIKTALSAM